MSAVCSERDVILLTKMEHHSNLVPWQLLVARTGAQLCFLPVREDGTLALERALRTGAGEATVSTETDLGQSAAD